MVPALFTIRGIQPRDLRDYPLEVKRMYWSWVVEFALRRKDQELAKGLDKDGEPLRAISARTRKYRRSAMTPTGKGDPRAPYLMPARHLSRTRSLLTGKAEDDHAEFWWRFDPWTGDFWGRVLEYHARRSGADVIGLSDAGIQRVQSLAVKRWADYKAGRHVPGVIGPRVAPPKPKVTAAGLRFPEYAEVFRQPAKVKIPGKPGRDYNVILRHIWGEEGPRGKAAAGAVVPKPPKPKPIVQQRVAMPPKPKPEPPRPKPALEEAVFAAWESKSNVADVSQKWAERREAIRKVLEDHATPGPRGAFHGMTNPESFQTIRMWGMDWHFSSLDDQSGIVSTMIAFSNEARSRGTDLAGLKGYFPDRLAGSTKGIYFTAQANDADMFWKQAYKNFSESHATGGDGKIVVYRNKGTSLGSVSHESGHNLATVLYGTTNPKGDYAAAIASGEPPTSDYAQNSSAEDFAEAVRLFVEGAKKMVAVYPERYRVIYRIMTEPNYAG